MHSLESELLELRTALKEAKHRNLLLEEKLQQARFVDTQLFRKDFVDFVSCKVSCIAMATDNWLLIVQVCSTQIKVFISVRHGITMKVYHVAKTTVWPVSSGKYETLVFY